MAKIPGLNISAPVVPLVDTDTYPSHRAMYGQGGWQEVATIADRDAITAPRREAGMAVYVTSEQRVFILNADLTTWTELKTKSLDSVRKTDTFTNFLPVEEDEIVQYVGATTENYTNGYFYTAVSNGEEPPTYTWTQINVQPVTEVINNLTSTSTTSALSANMGKYLQEEIDSLSGRGRFLSLWNCATGLAETNPPHSPYEYASGDYYIVSNLADYNATVTQLVGDTVHCSIDKTVYKNKVKPTKDRTDVFAYTNVTINKNQFFDEDCAFYIVDSQKFNDAYNECDRIGREVSQSPVIESLGMKFRIFNAWGSQWYFAIALEARTQMSPDAEIDIWDMGIRAPGSEYTEEQWKEVVIARLHDYFGIDVSGNFTIPNLGTGIAEVLNHQDEEAPTAIWTLNNKELVNESLLDYGLSISGAPQVGQVFEVQYLSPRNYKPYGTEYVIGVASTVLETNEVDIDDTYIYDGTVWRLQKNTQKEVSFEEINGSPYDNEALAEALDSKVKDVQVDGASVVNNGVAELGSMASEDADDYMTSTEVEEALAEKQDIIQYEELPEATEDNEGQVVQYIGDTDTYTHGYFYECVSDGADPATYSWQQISVQQGGSGGIAEGVVNHNSAQLIVNPIYDWVGTLAQYTDQNIETLHPEWICFITDDGSVTGGGSSGGSFVPENVGVEGDVLTRTSTGYAWAEGGSGKTEDENGNLYITDKFAVNSDDEQYPLIFRTKSEDDSNTIKINAPVEIIDNDGSPRSLRVSGTLHAKDTNVKSLTIDGTVRAHGNIWMGKGKQTYQKIQSENGVVFHREYYTGESWAWVSEDGSWQYVYSEKEIPEINDYVYVNSDLTDQYSTVTSSWEDSQWVWDSSKASIKDVKEISFHGDTNGFIDNVYKIRGQNWNIEGNGRAEFDSIHGGSWELDGDGTFRGKKIDLNSGNNRMGSLYVDGAIHVNGESTVTGTSHYFRDIKLYQKESGDGYARIYPEENETSSLGTPNHRFGKIYVKDIDISGDGGVDISHLDGVEEINENTLQFTKLADLEAGYYNEDGKYIGSTVTQYINSVDDLPMSIIAFVGANNITYKYGARINGVTAWHDEVYDTYVYTYEDSVSVGSVVCRDKAMTTLTTVKSVIREPNYTAINGGWSYDGEVVDVAEIGVEPGLGKLIKISDPGNRLLSKDIVYEYITNGNGQWGSYYMYQAKTSTASDWSDGVERQWLWFYNRSTPGVGTEVYAVCNGMSDPTVNALDLSTYKPVVSQILQQDVQYIKGLTTQGGSNPGDLKLIAFNSGGQIGSIWHGQYWDGSQLVDTYAWTTSWRNPRVGDTIYKATYSGGSQTTTEVIGTVTEIYRPDNSVAIDANTGDATHAHNYSQKHFNFYKTSLETVPNGDSIPVLEYGGFYGDDWTPYPPVATNWYGQRVLIYPDSNPAGSHIDFNSCTLAVGQSVEIYDMSLLNAKMTELSDIKYITIEQTLNHPDPSHAVIIKFYRADGWTGSATYVTIQNNGKLTPFGIQFTGVTTVDANTFVKIYYHPVGDTVKYTLNANDSTPTYQTTTLIDKSNLVWAFYADAYNQNSKDCVFSLAGGRVNTTGSGVMFPYRFYINSVERTGDWSTIKKRNPEIGDSLYYYRGNAPIDIPYYNDETRPVVKARTLVKTYRWKQVSGSTTNYRYTFARNPELNTYSWAHDKLGGIYSPLVSNELVSSIVPESLSGIYYLNPTSQYLYYNGVNFEECFYHAETSDNVYSDIKLNNFYYWRALDGSYAIAEGKEHEIVETHEDLPYPNLILLSVEDQSEWFFDRDYSSDTSTARAWKPNFSNIPVYYTDASIFVNHVGDKIYSDSSLTTEIGTIANVAYLDETVKVGNTEFTLSIGLDHSTYFIWQDENGNEIYSKMPNPEVGDVFYSDNTLETEYGSVTEIVSGEPKPGTFYEVEQIPTGESGRYFWNGNTFVEAEKLYKSITIYGEDNDLGKVRIPWNNVYAKSIESPYGTITTKEGHLEVNGGKITNVTTIKYNGADYIYTSVNAVNRLAIEDSGDMVRCEPVELGLNYCKWQSETNPEIVYYTPDTNINAEDDLYLDKECTEQSGLVINTVFRTPTQVFTWTSTSGNVVYSLIRQLLEDDEVYANDLCIREVNPMLITSSQYTDIFQESIIMNNDSITLVLRDVNGNVTGSCMLNAAKLNKLEQLLSE